MPGGAWTARPLASFRCAYSAEQLARLVLPRAEPGQQVSHFAILPLASSSAIRAFRRVISSSHMTCYGCGSPMPGARRGHDHRRFRHRRHDGRNPAAPR